MGDLIDRGPQSADCLGLLRCRWFRAVRGNHEQMALEALESGNMRLWQMNGGDWYVKGDARQRADVDPLTRGRSIAGSSRWIPNGYYGAAIV